MYAPKYDDLMIDHTSYNPSYVSVIKNFSCGHDADDYPISIMGLSAAALESATDVVVAALSASAAGAQEIFFIAESIVGCISNTFLRRSNTYCQLTILCRNTGLIVLAVLGVLGELPILLQEVLRVYYDVHYDVLWGLGKSITNPSYSQYVHKALVAKGIGHTFPILFDRVLPRRAIRRS
jgi:hypothetical protein